MTRVEQVVRTVHSRQQRQWFWRCVSVSSLCFALLACLIAALRIPLGEQIGWQWVVIPLIAGPLLGAFHAVVQRRSLGDAITAIDRTAGLKDRTATALGFLRQTSQDPLHRLQIADAERHLQNLDPNQIVPQSAPRALPAAIALGAISLAIVAMTVRPATVIASPEPNATLLVVADQLNADIEELKKFQEENQDAELEKLLKDLAVQIEALKSPGMDPKDAMAKLSEMEASLKDMQQQSLQLGTEAQLKEVGEALALSKEMASAGEAMAKGQMEKAAEELEKLDLPPMDLKTEKAISEKLDSAANPDKGSASQKSKNVAAASEQIREGIGQGDKSKFKEGAQKLASECKSQGKKKKLSDLLRKQCQSLSECKSQCESECNSKTDSKSRNPNKKAGSSSNGLEAGEKTAKLPTGSDMQLKGQDSGQGESDVETEQAPEQEQQAVRAYRQKVGEYEALNESALNSESIPLGQRQTIRKYFESIRPTHEEIQKVDGAAESK